MKILTFDIVGEFAHFRKVYSNSSSLSYFIPPKTTVNGILATILGLERDTYYEKLSSDNVNIAIKIVTPLRKMIHTINYIYYERNSNLLNRVKPTQVPFELIAGKNDKIRYRIYITMKDEEMFKELFELVSKQKSKYIPSLGALPFLCKTEFIGVFDSEPHICESAQAFDSVINMDYFVEDSLEIDGESLYLVKEQLPRNLFTNRNPDKLSNYLIEYMGNRLKLKVNCPYYKVNEENIVFM